MRHIYQHSKKVLILILLMALSVAFYGQDTQKKFASHWYLTGNVLSGWTHSDLSADNFFSNLGFGGGLGFGYQFSPIIGLNAKAQAFSLKGENTGFNMSFKNQSLDFTLNLTANLSNLFWGYKDRKMSFYSHAGLGQNQFRVKRYTISTGGVEESFGYKTDPADHHQGDGFGKRKVAYIFPVGFGVNFKATDDLDINLDVTTQYANTDWLDGRDITLGGQHHDWYSYLSAGVIYKLNLGGGLGKMVKDFDQVQFAATPKVLEEKGDMIDYEITGTFPEKYFSKNVAVLMQPILVYEGGQTELNTFTLKGEEVMGDGELIKYEGGKFTHKDTFKYTPEMNKSELVLIPLAYVAKQGTLDSKDAILASKNAELGNVKLADGVIYTSERIANQLNQVAGEHGYQKEVIVTQKANIYFAKNLYNLNWNLKLNKCEHSQKALKELKEFIARGWKIKSIDIDGWASPEGEETFNINLSENRAKTAKKYSPKLDLPKDAVLNVNFHGQDWNGFTEAIKNSNIADKDAIYNVVSRAGSSMQKEKEIRNMILIYPELEAEILPPLRRTEIAVNAFEPKKADSEILALAMSNPKSLSIEELLYAAYIAECKDKLGIYRSIMDQYPKCWKSKNNAALILMKDGKLDKAEKLLTDAHEMYPKVALISNNLGVLYSYKKEFDKAEKYFLKAQDLGLDVDYNLGVVEIDKGNYDKALRLFGNKTCDYNVALAQVLTGQYAKAENNLKCAKGCEGSIAYLMAVIGARTNNASMVYEYLIKAIKVNEDYKKIAKEDREFINFENTPDFKAIVE